jgi:hypothetical protein
LLHFEKFRRMVLERFAAGQIDDVLRDPAVRENANGANASTSETHGCKTCQERHKAASVLQPRSINLGEDRQLLLISMHRAKPWTGKAHPVVIRDISPVDMPDDQQQRDHSQASSCGRCSIKYVQVCLGGKDGLTDDMSDKCSDQVDRECIRSQGGSTVSSVVTGSQDKVAIMSIG